MNTAMAALPEMSIADAATRTDCIEASEPLACDGGVTFGQGFNPPDHVHQFMQQTFSASLRNYHLRNVHLDWRAKTLIKDGIKLKETYYLVPSEYYDQATDNASGTIRLDPEINYIMARAYDNYYHWMVQTIPAIDWSLRNLAVAGSVLVSGRLTKWEAETLAILGYDRVARMDPESEGHYLVPELDYSEFQNGNTAFKVSLSAQATYRRMAAAATHQSSTRSDIIYVARTDTPNRIIENEAEIIRLVESEGVQAIVPGNLSVEGQINLFGKADAVIGPHGAGLTNVVFCRPGSACCELATTHYINPCFARLAQAAGMKYTIDLFDSGIGESYVHSRNWTIDPDIVLRRIREIKAHVAALRPGPVFVSATDPADKDMSPTEPTGIDPIATIAQPANIAQTMLAFESLGDNCEFGLIQRHAGVEPLGLLRFAGLAVPVEVRLEKLVAALERGFDGLGARGSLTVYPEGQAPPREFLVRETAYDLMYHSGMHEGEVEADELRDRETTRLAFLRQKLLDDLQTGEKIWVWKSQITSDRRQVQPLLDALRRLGPNTLLWAVEADDTHRPGTVERLDVDLIKGYVERFAPYENATDVRPATWFRICKTALEFYRPGRPQPEPAIATALAQAADPFVRRLAEAAADSVTIERATDHRVQANIRLGESLSRNRHGAAFAAVGVTTTVQIHIIENALLDSDTLLLLQDGRAIPESVHYLAHDKVARPGTGQERLVRLGDGEDIVFGYNNAHRNYQNWLTECLPAIDWSLRQPHLRPVRLLLPALEPWQEDLLRLLGHDKVPRLTPAAATRYCLPRVEYADFLTGSTSFGICMSALDTARRILAAVPAAPLPHRVLYVPCTNPHYGSIHNEAEIADRLRLRGVYVVDRDRLSTADRINLFRHADAVIGPTGEGLSDILFCKPGTLLWEWMPQHHLNVSFNRLAQAAGVDYRGDLFQSVADGEVDGLWHVDTAALDTGLAQIFDRLAVLQAVAGTPSVEPLQTISAIEFLRKPRPDVPPPPLSATPAGIKRFAWLRRLFRGNRRNIGNNAD